MRKQFWQWKEQEQKHIRWEIMKDSENSILQSFDLLRVLVAHSRKGQGGNERQD